jgi:aminobenzoyl-glutamate utilization protein B
VRSPEAVAMCRRGVIAVLVGGILAFPGLSQTAPAPKRTPVPRRLAELKREAAADVERMAGFTQQTIDMLFSLPELGFHEVETSRYLVDILRKNGFAIEEGVGGMPTAWVATWGSGRPVIALGSDLDAIPKASQKPGVAFRDPLVEGAPGHGEGHNSGQAVNITAALAVKRIMEREKLPGTIRIWPGVAEELLAGKAHLVRAGVFKDVDAALFSHVSDKFSTDWGTPANSSGLVSVEYTFQGETAHSGGAPWRGKSALDGVELMNVGWNYRREHLRPQHRSHYVIPYGGDQPNVVPARASVWYYFRETEYPRIKELWDIGNAVAQGACSMTGTTYSSRVLGAAWPLHFNRPLAEVAHENVKAVGMPTWTEADQALARAVQRELKVEPKGLNVDVEPLTPPKPEDERRGGGSDDIGDVSWNVPTITLRYPSNLPNLPGHHWSNAITMATPIAHKGATAGAKTQAMTMLDLLLRPEVVEESWRYFRDVQTKDLKYTSFLGPDDAPPVWLNREAMADYAPKLKPYRFDPTRFKTYLEQLGIEYPTVRTDASR